MKQFEELGLSQDVIRTLEKFGFKTPTEIQKKTIPVVLAGRDVLGGSATGSGKTLAFAAPIIENLKQEDYTQALILTPTRELAEQVSEAIKGFSKKNLKISAVYGGVDMNSQIRRMKNADVIIGTPGRILDHINRRNLNFGRVKILVLDECDRMLDMGFRQEVEKIIRECPKKRQTLLFSATISADIDHFAKKYTTNPFEISVDSYVDSSKLKQIYYDVPDYLKFSLLIHLLKKEKAKRVMVFCNTRRNVDFIVENLLNFGIDAKAIHGGLEQKKRIRVIGNFHEGKVGVLVCTDVAARGLDIKEVTHIYNYDLPKDNKEYLHRIGRTARAGEEGAAINLVASRDYENFGNILNRESFKIPCEKTPRIEQVEVKLNSNRKSFGRNNSGRASRSDSRNNSRRGNYGSNSSRNNSRSSKNSSEERKSYARGDRSKSYSKNDSRSRGRNNYRGSSSRGNFRDSSGESRDSSRSRGRNNYRGSSSRNNPKNKARSYSSVKDSSRGRSNRTNSSSR
jgi:ATP-dependent RNA helicase DeaD